MYAIIKSGGKQYQVQPGTVFNVERLKVEPGQKVEFEQVLYLNDGKSVRVGTPYLDAVKVSGTVLENGKAEKVVIFKYKAKKDYRKKQGHRQPYTMVEVDSFEADGVEIARKPEKEEAIVAQKADGADSEATKATTAKEEKPKSRAKAKSGVGKLGDAASEKGGGAVKKASKDVAEAKEEKTAVVSAEAAGEEEKLTPVEERTADEADDATSEREEAAKSGKDLKEEPTDGE
ncbi:MAG: 50S ribosomal protein L21 [Clostridiales Family XIII bacterium]|nr:50S ribosomal protein L21 [Clostridiales Family XIII bacterium]